MKYPKFLDFGKFLYSSKAFDFGHFSFGEFSFDNISLSPRVQLSERKRTRLIITGNLDLALQHYEKYLTFESVFYRSAASHIYGVFSKFFVADKTANRNQKGRFIFLCFSLLPKTSRYLCTVSLS